jgi:hypothetical protein
MLALEPIDAGPVLLIETSALTPTVAVEVAVLLPGVGSAVAADTVAVFEMLPLADEFAV